MDTEDKVMDTIDIAKQNIDYSNYILYVDEYNNIEEMLKDVGVKGNYISFLINALHYTIDNPKDIELILKILKEGLRMNIWKTKDILTCSDNIKATELEDILVDAPFYASHLNMITSECIKEKPYKDYCYKKVKNGRKSVQR
jgi:hypothetical protein